MISKLNTDVFGNYIFRICKIFKICNYCPEKGTLTRAVKYKDDVILAIFRTFSFYSNNCTCGK